MSRHSYHDKTGRPCVAGWDAPTREFFAQVWEIDLRPFDPPLFDSQMIPDWRPGLHDKIDALQALLKAHGYDEIPGQIVELLKADRDSNPHFVRTKTLQDLMDKMERKLFG